MLQVLLQTASLAQSFECNPYLDEWSQSRGVTDGTSFPEWWSSTVDSWTASVRRRRVAARGSIPAAEHVGQCPRHTGSRAAFTDWWLTVTNHCHYSSFYFPGGSDSLSRDSCPWLRLRVNPLVSTPTDLLLMEHKDSFRGNGLTPKIISDSRDPWQTLLTNYMCSLQF